MKNLLDKLATIGGYAIWATPIIMYIAGFFYAIKLIWMPLIAIYGFWSLIGIILGVNIVMFGAAWLWNKLIDMTTVPHPMATYKENDNA